MCALVLAAGWALSSFGVKLSQLTLTRLQDSSEPDLPTGLTPIMPKMTGNTELFPFLQSSRQRLPLLFADFEVSLCTVAQKVINKGNRAFMNTLKNSVGPWLRGSCMPQSSGTQMKQVLVQSLSVVIAYRHRVGGEVKVFANDIIGPFLFPGRAFKEIKKSPCMPHPRKIQVLPHAIVRALCADTPRANSTS